MDYSKIQLEWEGDAPIFNDAPTIDASDNCDKAEIRFIFPRSEDLNTMIGRLATAMGFAGTAGTVGDPILTGTLAFCIVALLNPYKVKILSGSGIDELIENSKLDNETGERYVSKRDFLKFCHKKNLSSTIIDWLEDNGFSYSDDDRVVFRNSFKRGKIISTA